MGGLIAFGLMGFVVGPVLLALFVTLLGLYLEERDAAAAAAGEAVPVVHVEEGDSASGEGGEGGDRPV